MELEWVKGLPIGASVTTLFNRVVGGVVTNDTLILTGFTGFDTSESTGDVLIAEVGRLLPSTTILPSLNPSFLLLSVPITPLSFPLSLSLVSSAFHSPIHHHTRLQFNTVGDMLWATVLGVPDVNDYGYTCARSTRLVGMC